MEDYSALVRAQKKEGLILKTQKTWLNGVRKIADLNKPVDKTR
jgi:hypothetical protein